MNLGLIENFVLDAIQQKGANFSTGVPDWNTLNNPQYSQALVDAYINRGYTNLLADIVQLEMGMITVSFPSVQFQNAYPIPPTGYATMRKFQRAYYQPQGLLYTREEEAGVNLVSWRDFNESTQGGYLIPFSSTNEPAIFSIDPDRANLWCFPAPAASGDTITVKYSPIPTPGGLGCPTLVSPTDTPLLNDDFHDAIVIHSAAHLFRRERQWGSYKEMMQEYKFKIVELIERYDRLHPGDQQAFHEAGSEPYRSAYLRG